MKLKNILIDDKITISKKITENVTMDEIYIDEKYIDDAIDLLEKGHGEESTKKILDLLMKQKKDIKNKHEKLNKLFHSIRASLSGINVA